MPFSVISGLTSVLSVSRPLPLFGCGFAALGNPRLSVLAAPLVAASAAA